MVMPPGALSRIDNSQLHSAFGNKPELQLRAAHTDSGWHRCWYSVCQPRVLRHPEQYAETDASGVEAPLFRALSDLRINSAVKCKYQESVGVLLVCVHVARLQVNSGLSTAS
jgi:hypothetical protein